MTLFLTSSNRQDVVDANAQIESNCGIPCPGTDRWSDITKAYEQDFWFIIMPPESGWNEYSQAEMMHGVVNVEIQESNSSWWPPFNPPPEPQLNGEPL